MPLTSSMVGSLPLTPFCSSYAIFGRLWIQIRSCYFLESTCQNRVFCEVMNRWNSKIHDSQISFVVSFQTAQHSEPLRAGLDLVNVSEWKYRKKGTCHQLIHRRLQQVDQGRKCILEGCPQQPRLQQRRLSMHRDHHHYLSHPVT